jgi:hypothetical protein
MLATTTTASAMGAIPIATALLNSQVIDTLPYGSHPLADRPVRCYD